LWKHRLGGAMRQAGVIAAAGLYAFEHHVARLAEDHANAKFLEAGLAEIDGVQLMRNPVESNIVIFSVAKTGKSAAEVAGRLLDEHGVRMSPYIDTTTIRAVTHLDISAADCERAVDAVQAVCG
jgi:threonine aldolase